MRNNLSIVAAVGENGVIGKDGEIPWYLPADLKRFKNLTVGSAVIMGRKTFETLSAPLKDRENIVLTHDRDYSAARCKICHSKEEVLDYVGDRESYVAGGGEIYRLFLPFTGRLYITRIKKVFEGDTFFPEIDLEKWEVISEEKGVAGDRDLEYVFLTYERSNRK